jgi:Cd2+/Zn2+-exporting ATPase/Cu+-exporting ATPase
MNENCHVERLDKTPLPDELRETTAVALAVSGMGCPNCAMRVHNSLLGVHGVNRAKVDHANGVALVVFNPTLTDVPALGQAVVLAGGDGRHEYRVHRAIPID